MRRAKTGCVLLVFLLLGCGRKPDFDERYSAARQKLEASASAIDHEIAASDDASDPAVASAKDPQKSAN